MSKKTPISQISDDDLLKLLKVDPQSISSTNKVTEYLEYKNDVLDFISSINLKAGDNKITSKLLYKAYTRWSDKPIGHNAFTKELTDFFVYNQQYFLLNIKPLQLKKLITKETHPMSKTRMRSLGKHFQQFIKFYDLKSGGLYLKDIVLYNLYDKWAYIKDQENPISSRQFLRFLNRWFTSPPPKFYKKAHYFAVDKNIEKHLTPDLRKLMSK